ncbi:hypothetical protein GGI12_005482 [Dipsacomyces acuminosporus]|nr:hypothetical protein GGI12_005482 [Dipsacomyces acuminosporus]
MNPDTVAPRIRPFAFNPNSINPPRNSDATADIPLPAAKKPKAYTSKFTVQSSSPIPEPDDLSLDSKSVVIRDSSDDDFANELEFPDDILQVARSNSSARQYPCLQQHEQQLSPPAPPDEYVFNADLDPDTAIKAIKGIQSMLSDLAEEGIAIIRDMEAMIERYQHAVDQAIASEIQQKEALAAQWERAKKDSQMLLNSVKTYITQQLCR